MIFYTRMIESFSNANARMVRMVHSMNYIPRTPVAMWCEAIEITHCGCQRERERKKDILERERDDALQGYDFNGVFLVQMPKLGLQV